MAVKIYYDLDKGTRLCIGLSTDTKPTDVPPGSIFYESDSGIRLIYDGLSWCPLKEGAVQLRDFYINTFGSPTIIADDIWYISSGNEFAVRDKLTVEGKIEVEGKLLVLKK